MEKMNNSHIEKCLDKMIMWGRGRTLHLAFSIDQTSWSLSKIFHNMVNFQTIDHCKNSLTSCSQYVT